VLLPAPDIPVTMRTSCWMGSLSGIRLELSL